jgi:serine/threonine protein kinase
MPALEIGSQVGHYRILGRIGAGGMGEVYRASDPRLGREVAVKVLPPAYSADSDRLRRFEGEARAAGSLNHPGLLTIFDVGSHAGAPYIVSELLEGETLRAELQNGALPQQKAVDYGIQIATALAEVHSKGIVHRDLKPENLFVAKDGRVKILDFGLAKLTHPETDAADGPDASTFATDTQTGSIVGTVGYMSPEQLRGERIDPRSDLFAVGAILYEMLSGKRPFTGDSTLEISHAILTLEPPSLPSLAPGTSPALEQIVLRCLAKKREQRLQSAQDLAFDLEVLSSHSLENIAVQPARRVRHRLLRRLLLVGGGVLALVLAWGVTSRFSPKGRHLYRFTIAPPPGNNFREFAAIAAISPDGQRIAFAAADTSNRSRIWIRPLDSVGCLPVPGTEGGWEPFWSPNGESIGFFADGKLKLVSAAGGVPRVLADADDARGGAWNRKGEIVFAPQSNGSLLRVSETGGAVTPVTTADSTGKPIIHRWPCFLPDGVHFTYLSFQIGQENHPVYLGSLESSKRTLLLDAAGAPVYAPAGYLIYSRGGALVAQAFDAKRLELRGDPISLTTGLSGGSLSAGPVASASTSGVLVYRDPDANPETRVLLIHPDDSAPRVLALPTAWWQNPRFSPDGRMLAMERWKSGPLKVDLWLLPLSNEPAVRFTFSPGGNRNAVWSADGTRIVYALTRGDSTALYEKPTNGASPEHSLFRFQHMRGAGGVPIDWSRDGRFVLLAGLGFYSVGLSVLPLEGDRRPIPYLASHANQSGGRFSPDGRWVAYVSDESGQFEVYAQSFPDPGIKYQVSSEGGSRPRWRSDGKEIYYLGREGNLMAVSVQTSPTLRVSPPRLHIRMGQLPIQELDVSSDGREAVCTVPGGNASGSQSTYTVVVNWTEGLRRNDSP